MMGNIHTYCYCAPKGYKGFWGVPFMSGGEGCVLQHRT